MFKVMAERCDQCLYSKDKIVSNERMRQVLAECLRNDSFFICHKSSMVGGNACCRGFYDANPYSANIMRIAARLNMVAFVTVEKETEDR